MLKKIQKSFLELRSKLYHSSFNLKGSTHVHERLLTSSGPAVLHPDFHSLHILAPPHPPHSQNLQPFIPYDLSLLISTHLRLK